MDLLRDIAPYVALGAAVLAVVLAVLLLSLWTKLRRLRTAQSIVLGHHEQRDVVGHMEDLDEQVRNMRAALEAMTGEIAGHDVRLDTALSNLAVVRYDAFHDAGGEQSASVALLDNHRSGVVFSSIAARDFSRMYVKFLHTGIADRELSPEEHQAMTTAVPQPRRAPERRGVSQNAGTPRPAESTTDEDLPS